MASPLGFAPFDSGPAPHSGDLRVGILGRLDPWKGQHVFLDAFAAAFGDGGAEAVIVGTKLFGDDGYLEELERQVKALGLEGRVEFRGFRDRVDDELRSLDVLVHASTIPEPFGQVVVEGMAAGLAVVAADAGGPAEVITHGVDGLLYPPGDFGRAGPGAPGTGRRPGAPAPAGGCGPAPGAGFHPGPDRPPGHGRLQTIRRP